MGAEVKDVNDDADVRSGTPYRDFLSRGRAALADDPTAWTEHFPDPMATRARPGSTCQGATVASAHALAAPVAEAPSTAHAVPRPRGSRHRTATDFPAVAA